MATKFRDFYTGAYHAEHRVPANIALHVAGTLLSAAFAMWALASGNAWFALLYPVVHVLPGLLGHRLFERNAAAGDLRIDRRDHPLWWFIIANHRLTWDVARGRAGRTAR